MATVLCAGRLAAQTNGSVQIVEPEDGARFDPHTNITLTAETDIAGVRRIEFLSGTRVIGSVSNEPYSLVWSNAPVGSHQIIARAIPAAGANVDSRVIGIRVYNALLTFGLDRIAALNRKFFDIPLWQFAAALIYIFLAFYISKILDFLTRVWLKRWAEKTSTKFDDLLLDVLNGPIKVIVFIIFLRIGLEVFIWPPVVQAVLAKGFTIVIAWTLTYMTLKFVDLVMGYWRQRARPEGGDRSFEEQLFPVIRKSLKVFIIVVGVLVTLDNIGVNITAALASLSIGGLAIGLAAQDTLANLFGAVAVFVDKPFRVGDHIKLSDAEGTVESIGMRSTRVRNLDGHVVTIPNKTMGNAAITNVTQRPTIKTVINFGLTYDTTTGQLKRAVQILEEIYRGHPQTHDVIIAFNNFGDSALNINVIHWWKGTDGRACLAGMQEMNFKVKDRFEAERLDFAFPSRTIYLKQEPELTNQPTQKS